MTISEEYIQSLLQLGRGEALEYDKSQTMVDLFKEQVLRTPDAIAVIRRAG